MSKSAKTATKLPIIAIVGRPNVGKSTLINRIIGARQAIVDDQPGVTRDRAYYTGTWQGHTFQLVDTGGVVPETDDFFGGLINEQVAVALAEADLIVFLTDGQAGLTTVDEKIGDQLRKSGKPVLLAVNKIDHIEQKPLASEFYALGLGEPYTLSAMHGNLGVGDLLDIVVSRFPNEKYKEGHADPIRLALVGRPNVGKSSILNALAGENRAIVSDIPGTTRDALNLTLTWEGRDYTIIDTAGIRKKAKVGYGVEMFSVDRAIRAIRQSSVTAVVLDALQIEEDGIADQEKKIIDTAVKAGCGLVLIINKWDAVADKNTVTTEKFKKILYHQLPHASFAEVCFVSAKTGKRLPQVYELVQKAFENNNRRVKTNLVNQVLMEAVALTAPPTVKNKTLKILYATQVSAAPPTFVLFVNDAKLLKISYRRYLEKKIREAFEFTGSPIVILARNREKEK